MAELPAADQAALLQAAADAGRQGDLATARRGYETVLHLAPENVAAGFGLGDVLVRLGLPDQAVPLLAATLRREPSHAAGRDGLATALRMLGRYQEAGVQHSKAIALAPDELRYRENYAETLLAVDAPKALLQAQRELETMLARQPDRIETMVALSALQIRRQQPQAALAVLDRAVQLAPQRFEVLRNRAAALSLAGRLDEALADSDRLVALYPDNCMALCQRGTTREHAGDYAAALADYTQALAAPHGRRLESLAETEFKRVLLLLSLGRLAEAWPLYRARMQVATSDPRGQAIAARLPAWDGIARSGGRLLVWGEQGVGDQILFGSMLPDLAKTGLDILFCCDPRLVPLFRRSLHGLRIEPLAIPVDPAAVAHLAGQADMQAGLGDLGVWLRPALPDRPPAHAYLRPDPPRVAALRQRYAAHGKKMIVGITWRSGNARLGTLKSSPLADWDPLLKRDDVLFVDMQYGDTAEERAQVKSRLGIDILHDDSIDAMQDLDGYAAQAAALDLLIGNSNSGIHIAAAVGTECWVLVPSGLGRLWYWHLGRDDSPWYPHVRLFRQPVGTAGDWHPAIAAAAAALERRLREETA